MAVGKAQVNDWLRSMELEHFLQAFLDNGYDDMEVCRQIGHPDLDAIGVDKSDERLRILEAVQTLLDKDKSTLSLTGQTPVYYTLENPEYDDPPGPDEIMDYSPVDDPPKLPPRGPSQGQVPPSGSLQDAQPMGGTRGTQGHRNGLDGGKGPLDDNSNDALQNHQFPDPHLTNPQCSGAVVTATYPDDQMSVDSFPSDRSRHPSDGSRNLSDRSRNPSGGTTSSSSEGGRRTVGIATADDGTAFRGSFESLNKEKTGAMEAPKKTSTLGRLLGKHGRSPKTKYTYKQHQGDLSATQMTMSDSERMQLMLQVKSGKMTIDEVMAKVNVASSPGPPDGREAGYSTLDGRGREHYRKAQQKTSNPVSKIKSIFKKSQTRSQKYSMEVESQANTPDPVRKGSLPLSVTPSPLDASYSHPQPDRESARAAAELKHGQHRDNEDWQKSSRPHTEDLNSDGMSERTPSSSLDSVHSISGMHSHSSSSSLDDGTSRQSVCLARAKVDFVPSPYDKEALKLKRGDIIQVLQKTESGNWVGRLQDRVGYFKFINVDVITEDPTTDRLSAGNTASPPPAQRPPALQRGFSRQSQGPSNPSLVEQLLKTLGLQHLVSVFLLNGILTLDDFKELCPGDLEALRVCPEDQGEVMAAVRRLVAGKAVISRDSRSSRQPSDSPHSRRHRDSQAPRVHPTASPSRGRSRKTLMPASRKIDSGFESIISVESRGRESEVTLRDFDDRLNNDDYSLATAIHDCDSETRHRTFSQSEGSKINPHLMRGRTNSLDPSSPTSQRKTSRSRLHEVAADLSYSSAPNTPVLQRGSMKPPRPRDYSPGSQGLVTAQGPHVKTAHIRSLGLASKSVPSSPALLPRVSPAARSSLHLRPRGGATRQARTHSQPRGGEARAVDAEVFTQGEKSMVTQSTQKHTVDPSSDSVSVATILNTTGLVQYEAEFRCRGLVTKKQFLELTESEFRDLGIINKDHLQQLLAWQRQLEIENGLLQSGERTPGTKSPRVSSVRDRV